LADGKKKRKSDVCEKPGGKGKKICSRWAAAGPVAAPRKGSHTDTSKERRKKKKKGEGEISPDDGEGVSIYLAREAGAINRGKHRKEGRLAAQGEKKGFPYLKRTNSSSLKKSSRRRKKKKKKRTPHRKGRLPTKRRKEKTAFP